MSDTLALAGRLQLLDDDALVALVSTRLNDARGIKDFFDLADRLLDAASVDAALATLPRRTLAALAHPSAEADPADLEPAARLFLTDGQTPGRALDAVTRVLESWPDRGLPSAEQLADEPAPEDTDLAPQRDTSDRMAAERAFTATAGIAELLHELRATPVRELAKGGVAAPDAKRLLASLAIEPNDLDALLRIARRAGLVTLDDLLWTATDDALPWLLKGSADRWIALATSWLDALADDIGEVLRSRSRRPWGADAQRTIAYLYPAGGEPLRRRVAFVLDSAEYLGITANGYPGAAARALLDNTTEPLSEVAAVLLPAEVSNVYLQHDLTVIAPGPLTPDVDVRLRTLADIEGRGLASTYRISAASVTRALAEGETAEGILAFFRSVSLTGVPQPVEYLVTEASSRYGRLRAGAASPEDELRGIGSYVRSDDDALLSTLAVDHGLASLGLEHDGGDRLTSRFPFDTLFWMISDARYPVVAERASGATFAPVRARLSQKTPAPKPRPFVDLVARLRESAHAVDDAPEAWIARQLDVAIKAKSPLAVSVGMPDDKTVVFLVTPLSLAAGRLRAIDEKAGVERTLPLRNITAVAPAP
ncbi:helicase-associated domain-containing protein [Agreia sp. VKM Ac-1783]|uniref:helicase-associated domain-containing protein n=1 Tax=Agreia sp. VKM Ac-1783 TaxID=1938889 RepID=UPI000A2AB484|nr:helicase-associated domain-containing protein [Agreia sp. VKM Ac-1783]SMQ71870.1 Helicase conserved C-terminal domain-containing protein [Agreia sp. VKM Ac-1783]